MKCGKHNEVKQMDSQINAVIENLCSKFDVSVDYLVPRMQAYKMAMCQFGFITAVVFVVAIGIFCGRLISRFKDDVEFLIGLGIITVLCESIPVIVLLVNIYDYIGWKYAPEIKMIEYVAQLVKR